MARVPKEQKGEKERKNYYFIQKKQWKEVTAITFEQLAKRTK